MLTLSGIGSNAVRQGRLRKTPFNKAKPLKFNSKSRGCHRRSRPLHAHVRTFYPYARNRAPASGTNRLLEPLRHRVQEGCRRWLLHRCFVRSSSRIAHNAWFGKYQYC